MARIPSTRIPIIITEYAYAQAVIHARAEGMSVAEYTEAALIEAGKRTEAHALDAEYAAACDAARATRRPNPTRAEYFGQQQQPFVRRQRSASENQAGRPSSRHHQNGTAAQAGSKAAKPGPERPAATRSAASMARTREDLPFDATENRVTPWLDDCPDDGRWAPMPGEVQQPARKHINRLQN